MEPDTNCLLYLSRNYFIRNLLFEKFLEKNNNQIEFENYICYSTGIANGKKIIHGHTPIENPDLQKHRVNLDTGAYLTGTLTIGIFEHNRISIL